MTAKTKIPCATCPDMCEDAINLYRLYHLAKDIPGMRVEKLGLKCHKTGLYCELKELREK